MWFQTRSPRFSTQTAPITRSLHSQANQIHFTSIDSFQRIAPTSPLFGQNQRAKIYRETITYDHETYKSEQSWTGLTEVHELQTPSGQTIHLRKYAPDTQNNTGPVTLFLSGLSDVQMGGDPFTENGQKAPFPIFSLDRNYVTPEGKVELDPHKIDEASQTALDYLYQLSGSPVNVAGFSFGGLYTARLASKPENHSKINRVALMSASLFPPAEIEKRVKAKQDNPSYARGYGELTTASKDALSQLTIPTALFYGEDEGFDYPYIETLLPQIPAREKTYQVFPGKEEGHEISPTRLKAMTEWLQKPAI